MFLLANTIDAHDYPCYPINTHCETIFGRIASAEGGPGEWAQFGKGDTGDGTLPLHFREQG